MKLKNALLACITATSSLLASGWLAPAHADTFQGTVWSITYEELARPEPVDDPLNETWRIWVGVETTGYNGSASFLDQVAVKVGDSVVGARLVAAPIGPASWTLQSGGLSAGGCQGTGNGFVCIDSGPRFNSGKGVHINPGVGSGLDYSWVFDVTMPNGTLFTDADSSIQARFVDLDGMNSGPLVSEPIRLSMVSNVPEPGSYAMLLAGLGLVMGAVARRRTGKSRPIAAMMRVTRPLPFLARQV